MNKLFLLGCIFIIISIVLSHFFSNKELREGYDNIREGGFLI